ncbi:site-specific integrase [Psychrobacter sp. 1176_08]|uniref:Arm DNA-binding domain-containing protein n=1 Tax=Psychrobacter sp. 1176_08 TaxID=2604452 RepID=UPI004064123D
MASIRSRRGKLFVDFRYMNMRCRETTNLTDTPANRKKLAKIIEKMEAEITLNIFDYAAYFPKSERAQEMTALADRAEACISRNPTFKEFSETFFEERKIEWRPSYRQKIKIILNKYLLPEFGGKAVHAIKKPDLLTFRSSLAKVRYGKDGQSNLSVARINQIMILLRMILEEASDRHEFEMPYKNIKNLKQARPDVNPFTLSEVWLILKNVRTDYRPYYTIRFFTGMRTSEIDGLKWDCINFDRREISIRGALVNGEMGPTKTLGSQRDIAISQLVYDALLEQKARTYGKSEFVFCNSQGNPMEYRNVNRRVWKPTLALLGLKHRRAYQTRHTAATLWLAAGENPEWIARQMGHSSTEMLFRVYSRYVPDITRQDGSAMDNLLLASKEKLTSTSNSSDTEALITNAQTDKETSQ